MKSVTRSQFNWTLVWFLVLIFVGAMMLMSGFFVFTIGTSKPTKMQLFEPKENQDTAQQYKSSDPAALTLILDKNDIIYYYEGELAVDGSNMKSSSFSDIRKIIVEKSQSTDSSKFVVLIKPSEKASYKNTVDILDEMTIDNVKRYSMIDLSPREAELIDRR